MPIYVRSGGTWKQPDPLFAKEAGIWKPVQLGWVRNGGVWKNFYTAEVAVIAPTTLTTQNVATIFNNAEAGLWAADKKKRLIVNSSIGPLTINSAFGGDLIIEVTSTGIISGLGGAAGVSGVGGAGGNAMNITVATGITLINEGTIRGGGGGGGRGGTGGAGSAPVTVREPASGQYGTENAYGWNKYPGNFPQGIPGQSRIIWNSTLIWSQVGGPGSPPPFPASPFAKDGYLYYQGTSFATDWYGIYRTHTTTAPTSGGAGGAGGRGQGADGAQTSGSAGAAGGTNAGAGGTGGTGGTFGNPGAAGATGAAGNVGSGSAGSSGGAAGKAINGYNRVNYSGSGTLLGGTANT